MENKTITVEVFVDAPVKEVWKLWSEPQHIIKWNKCSEDWQTFRVENNLSNGGSFLFVMGTKDGKEGFDFKGVYDTVVNFEMISYTLSDGRKATNIFIKKGTGTTITETFEPEPGHSEKEQQLFCASVLENFKNYAESQSGSARTKV